MITAHVAAGLPPRSLTIDAGPGVRRRQHRRVGQLLPPGPLPPTRCSQRPTSGCSAPASVKHSVPPSPGPTRQVYCIIGDGAFGFHPQEIETAVRNGLNVSSW